MDGHPQALRNFGAINHDYACRALSAERMNEHAL
jgi:hypothetical protein